MTMRYGSKDSDWTGYLTPEELESYLKAKDLRDWHLGRMKFFEAEMVGHETTGKAARAEARRKAGHVPKPKIVRKPISPITEVDVIRALQLMEDGTPIKVAASMLDRSTAGLRRLLTKRGFDPADGNASAAKLCAAIETVRSGGEIVKVANATGIDVATLVAAVNASREHDKRLIYAQPAMQEAAE